MGTRIGNVFMCIKSFVHNIIVYGFNFNFVELLLIIYVSFYSMLHCSGPHLNRNIYKNLSRIITTDLV